MDLKQIIGLAVLLVILGILVYRMIPVLKGYFGRRAGEKSPATENVKTDSEKPL